MASGKVKNIIDDRLFDTADMEIIRSFSAEMKGTGDSHIRKIHSKIATIESALRGVTIPISINIDSTKGTSLSWKAIIRDGRRRMFKLVYNDGDVEDYLMKFDSITKLDTEKYIDQFVKYVVKYIGTIRSESV